MLFIPIIILPLIKMATGDQDQCITQYLIRKCVELLKFLLFTARTLSVMKYLIKFIIMMNQNDMNMLFLATRHANKTFSNILIIVNIMDISLLQKLAKN